MSVQKNFQDYALENITHVLSFPIIGEVSTTLHMFLIIEEPRGNYSIFQKMIKLMLGFPNDRKRSLFMLNYPFIRKTTKCKSSSLICHSTIKVTNRESNSF